MNPRVMTHAEASRMLRAAGVPVARDTEAATAADVPAAFAAMGAGSVVLKASGLVHKTEAGGVVVGIADADAAAAHARHLLDRLGADALPFLLQEQRTGVEMLVGAVRDPRLGAAVTVGIGGIATEIHHDVTTELAPLTAAQAHDMLRRLRSWPLLAGYRGRPGADVDALVSVIVAVSELVAADPAIVELDLNPVLVAPPGLGAVAVDLRVVVAAGPPARTRPRHNLTRMLRPGHVAVVGVSDDPTKTGARLFRHLDQHGFPGRLDPVHPSGGSVRGRPRATSLAEVPGSPDLVCVAVPSHAVAEVARQAAAKRVGGVIVHSADFAETGAEGRRLQIEVRDVLAAAGVPLVGPNTLGVVVPPDHLAASISGGLEGPMTAGRVALLTGSGALGGCLATRLVDRGVGLSYWATGGNEADVNLADHLDWLAADDRTDVVGLQLEDVADGPALVAAGQRAVAAGKRLFAYTMARSAEGRAAALSHTGAMVGPLALRRAVVRAAGAIEVASLQVLEDALALAAAGPAPRGPRLAVVSFSGGACSVIADELEDTAVTVPDYLPATAAAVGRHVPSSVTVRNPLDVGFAMHSRPDDVDRVLDEVGRAGEFDALLVQFMTNGDPRAGEFAHRMVKLRNRSPVPLYVARYGAAGLAPAALAVYREAGVPVLDAPDRVARAVAAVVAAGCSTIREGAA